MGKAVREILTRHELITAMKENCCRVLLLLLTLSLVGNGSVLAQRGREVKVYLIALNDNGQSGKKIGCDDSLVPVSRKISSTAAPLRVALQELLSAPPESGDNPKLLNFWKGKRLRVRSVSIRKGTATIHISGEVFVAGVCDQPRIESQIEETARQFPNVKRVRVFIGNRTLADAIR